jgi:uncharacterized protein YidB (DUF937 family)
MPTKKPFLKAYLTPEEYAQVSDLAAKAGLSKSELIRRCSLGREIPSRVDQRAVLALLKANADLGRLGGLLKQRLAETPGQTGLRPLLNSIETTKRDMAAGMKTVIRQLLAGNKA